MKLNKLFLIGLTIMGLASCVSEELKTKEDRADKGSMLLNISMLQPQSTRANSQYTDAQLAAMTKVTNYPVHISDADGNAVAHYERVSDFPTAGIVLPVGTYSVLSHTPGDIQKKMSSPYYQGTETMEIVKDVETDVDVVCTMLNSKIEVKYSQEFLDLFATWSITLDDGSSAASNPETALSFTNTDGTAPDPVYWYFEDNVGQLTVNFKATLKSDGSTVSDRATLDKTQATQHYDNDNVNFTGGDALVLNFNPTEATTGKITGVTINATVSFDSNTTNKTETLDITDKSLKEDDDDNNNNNDDPTPGGDDNDKPSFDCPELETGVVYSIEDEEYPNTQVKILTPKGMKSLKVTIVGGNDGFAAACEDIGLTDYELVGDTKLPRTFTALGVEDATMPSGGETEYSFPVGAFYVFMNIYGETDPGKAHTFKMVVTDNAGNTKEAVLRVTITE